MLDENNRKSARERLTLIWPAAGSVDTEIRCFTEPEVEHGAASVQSGVQAYPYGEGRLALTAACGDKSGKGGSMIVSTWNKWALIRMSGGRDGVPALAGRKRRAWTQDEKRRIVDESFADGASIAEVARRHDLNANQVFTWRRQIGGEPVAPKELTPILPVTIVAEPAAEESDPASSGQMEIVLAEGDRIIVWADVETAALTRVLKALARR